MDELMPRVRIMADTKMPGHPWKDMDNMEIMRSAGLYEDNPYSKEKGFNLAGILLFGTDETILTCCPGYVTDCILRRVDLDRYDDRLMIRTNLIDAYNQAIQFIREYTPDPFYIEGVQRVSVRDKIARELVSNSLDHREFSTTRIARIIIEKDRIYADNWSRSSQSGKLDPTTFVPEPKNPLLAHFFENIGYADQLGSGVRNLYKYTAIYTNGGEPELVEGDTFKAIIPLPDTVTPEVTEKVTEKELDVLNCIIDNPAITSTEIAKLLQLSRKTISVRIKTLKASGIIKRIGSDKKGYWEIINQD
ncbi:MAG: winged helix-turn-helix transcriptional regulator [Clostridiales Family XIII bacterium]|nr:winged helix-turn-helix transcriptional regulator [Clostridiales Family XIII bacterium]